MQVIAWVAGDGLQEGLGQGQDEGQGTKGSEGHNVADTDTIKINDHASHYTGAKEAHGKTAAKVKSIDGMYHAVNEMRQEATAKHEKATQLKCCEGCQVLERHFDIGLRS